MESAAQPDGLDQGAIAPQRIAHVLPRNFADSQTDHELGARRDLGVQAADVRNDFDHALPRRRLEQVMTRQAARDECGPGQLRNCKNITRRSENS